MSAHPAGEDSVERLRAEFDDAFVAAPRELEPTEAFLAFAAGGERHAIRVSDVLWFSAEPRITPLPGDRTACRGLASVRGLIVPVYDLAALLGRDADASGEARFVVALGRDEPAAVAFAEFHGHRNVPASAIARAPGDASASAAHTGELLVEGESTRPVLAARALLRIIEERARGGSGARQS